MKTIIYLILKKIKEEKITSEAKELRDRGKEQFQKLIDLGLQVPVANF